MTNARPPEKQQESSVLGHCRAWAVVVFIAFLILQLPGRGASNIGRMEKKMDSTIF